MVKFILGFIVALGIIGGVYWFSQNHGVLPSSAKLSSQQPAATSSTTPVAIIATNTVTQTQLTQMAGDKYADGNLPLGDNKYVTDAPKKGYIYLCNAQKTGGGSNVNGPWIHGNTWNIKEKIAVTGSKQWSNASFSNTISNGTRTLIGNDLPISHATGIFPIQSTDKAYQYDRNPNSIKTQSFTLNLPVQPTIASTPSCMGGEVGVMVTGVPIFNGFDAENRDAPAHEEQDSCQGHPQESGEYHYHSLSSCINNVNVSTVIGFALDGFPITGPTVSQGKYLTTDDLDECHGITSEITLDGKKVAMYHYVMTEDFPYSVSCFRGKVTQKQVIKNAGGGQQSSQQQGQMPTQSGAPTGSGGSQQQPPQAAITACSSKSKGTSCSFTTPNGTISGTCDTPPNSTTLTCIPVQKP